MISILNLSLNLKKGVCILKSTKITFSDQQLQFFCQQAALICMSSEFRQLHKELSKLYRRRGVRDPKLLAFQDSLYCLYSEQVDGEITFQSHWS